MWDVRQGEVADVAEAGDEALLSCPVKTSDRLLSNSHLTYSLSQNVVQGHPPGLCLQPIAGFRNAEDR